MKHRLFLALGFLAIVATLPSCTTSGSYGNAYDSAAAPALEARKSERVPGENRPGLATTWGDEKKSDYVPAYFVRASSKPAGTDAIFYNDRKGIEAMTSYKKRVEPLQTAAGGLVEWGIKGGIGYLPSYKENGYGRRLVAGEKNGGYSIVVKNRCRSALEIVASVDGLDVQDGKSASFQKRGYILQPGKSLEIEGFRTSYDKVASFKFSGVANSYANLRHGDTRNVGVIGIAVFTQKNVDPWEWMPREVDRRDTARPFATAP
ncbi:MAG: hypothetical protein KDN05_08210 [Verrucomicrobiae bacterium]|nr:hypothetical protein [Verrucomicrobiae bacterium]